MNADIRKAEDARAAIVAKVSANPKLFSPDPLRTMDAGEMDGPHSAAIRVMDKPPLNFVGELRVVSMPAEEAMLGRICNIGKGALTPDGYRTAKLLLACIGIANYSMGLIVLRPTVKQQSPFIHRTGEMGGYVNRGASALTIQLHGALSPHDRDVSALIDNAGRLAAYKDKLLRSVYTQERLKIIDDMRTIILAYSSYPPP